MCAGLGKLHTNRRNTGKAAYAGKFACQADRRLVQNNAVPPRLGHFDSDRTGAFSDGGKILQPMGTNAAVYFLLPAQRQ